MANIYAIVDDTNAMTTVSLKIGNETFQVPAVFLTLEAANKFRALLKLADTYTIIPSSLVTSFEI